MKTKWYQITMEGSGAKLIVGGWELADQLIALIEGNEDIEYKVKAINLTDEEVDKLGDFEGF